MEDEEVEGYPAVSRFLMYRVILTEDFDIQ